MIRPTAAPAGVLQHLQPAELPLPNRGPYEFRNSDIRCYASPAALAVKLTQAATAIPDLRSIRLTLKGSILTLKARGAQKFSFSPSWPTRGATEVLVILPNADGPSLNVVSGFPNCALLKALKNSARNSSATLCFKAMVFLIARSTLCWAGPRSSPGLVLPKAVPPSELVTGGLLKQAVLKYWLRRPSTEPSRPMRPSHPAALGSR